MVEYGIKEEKTSKAMRAYLERSQAYNRFMAQEQEEYRTGKRHLANIMGKDAETFTQSDVNEAIEYLFPSGLFVKKTRPFLKPPEEVHPPKKEAEFDETGRPFHFLFYTGKPNFYEYLHKIVTTMKELNIFEDTMIRKQQKPDPALALTIERSHWLPKEQFERKFIEEITIYEYRQLIAALERLASHPFSYRVKDIITDAQVTFTKHLNVDTIPKPELQEDGREFVTYNASSATLLDHIIMDRSVGVKRTGVIDASCVKDHRGVKMRDHKLVHCDIMCAKERKKAKDDNPGKKLEQKESPIALLSVCYYYYSETHTYYSLAFLYSKSGFI
ncbi:37S ribosomal protein S9, mitochondrial [Homalodisca vitripennis]|nr:37S ribosomal protein S9, mitochondrial [Homalodisca vitripennis]